MVEATIKPGQAESFKALVEELVQSARNNEPNTLTYKYFISEDNRACHVCERYADSAAAMTHLTTFGERFAERFLGLADVTRLTVYGSPNDQVRGVLGGMGASFLGQFNGFAR